MATKRAATFGIVVLAIAIALAPAAPAEAAKAAKKRQVLFFTKSSGYEHSVVRKRDAEPTHTEKVLKELGEKNNFEVTHTKDGGVFTAENLAKYDVIFFYTSGDLTTVGTDKNPPMSPAGKEALLDAIKKGKGFVGTHAASDTFRRPDGFVWDGDKADPYIKMLGGEFIAHGSQQPGKILCADAKFPGMAGLKDGFELHDEWYSLKNLAPDLHVLLYNATWSLKNTDGNSSYRRPPYPSTWIRMHGKGRVFYTSMGHREDVWTNPLFQGVLTGGIKWAAGDVKADVRPNITAVTPGYAEMPPRDPPKPKTPSAATASGTTPLGAPDATPRTAAPAR
jgi:type 1 glutamine amidotransferase